MTTATQPYASLQEFAALIAQALGGEWKRSTRFDAEDRNWRAELEGPGEQRLFLSNTWANKGRLYIGGEFPTGAQLPYKADRPSITVDASKSAQQIAKDITRRLLPPYVELLATVLKMKSDADTFETGRQKLAQDVAEVVGGRVQSEMVHGWGGWSFQVSSPTSIRVYSNTAYLTLEQLRKIKDVCPELFERQA